MLLCVCTYSVFFDPNCKPLKYVGLWHWIADFIPTSLIIVQKVRAVWCFAQGHVNSNIGWGWDLSPAVIVQTSVVQESLCCPLLSVMLPDSTVVSRPKLKFGDLEESPTRISSLGQSCIFLPLICWKQNQQGFEPAGHTQFQEICDKLFLCCLVAHGFNEAAFPQAWKNLALQLDEGESFLTRREASWNEQ